MAAGAPPAPFLYKTESVARQIHMDTLPPELLNLIVAGNLGIYDKLAAASRAIAAHLVEPPILVDGVPIDNHEMTREIHAHGRVRNITRGTLSLYYYVTSNSDVLVVFRDFIGIAARIFRGYDGPAPIFVTVSRVLPGTNQPIVADSVDARNVMVEYGQHICYHFDIDIMVGTVYVHISNLKKVLDSGKWFR